jgi:hypothetical protein
MSTTPNGDAPQPARRAVATYATHDDAERAVEYLADNRFPIEHLAIVGRDLRVVEQVTGPLGPGDAVVRGAVTGAITGILIGWLFALFSWFDPLVSAGWLIFDGFWFGTIVGAVMGLLIFWAARGRRSFEAVPAMVAQFYDIVVDDLYAEDAARMLQGLKLPSRVRVDPPSAVRATVPLT